MNDEKRFVCWPISLSFSSPWPPAAQRRTATGRKLFGGGLTLLHTIFSVGQRRRSRRCPTEGGSRRGRYYLSSVCRSPSKIRLSAALLVHPLRYAKKRITAAVGSRYSFLSRLIIAAMGSRSDASKSFSPFMASYKIGELTVRYPRNSSIEISKYLQIFTSIGKEGPEILFSILAI